MQCTCFTIIQIIVHAPCQTISDALVVPMAQGNPRLARSKLGSYYERLPDGTNSIFGKDSNVQLENLKVYHGVYEEGEYVPFTDAEPFALY